MNDAEILNVGLIFALEFGPNWLQPIQTRLADKYSHLGQAQLDHYDKVCRSTMNKGHDFIYKSLESAAKQQVKISQADLKEKLETFLRSKYPWVSEENLDRIFSQGCYYAWKDGLDHAIQS